MFNKKTIVEKYEDQFKVKEMHNKHMFYDLYARVGDPEELRKTVLELLQDTDWKTSINEMMKFEDTDTEGIFRGGKLKPIKSIVKAFKEVRKGAKFPFIWKSFFFIGLGLLIAYLYTLAFPTNWNSNLLIMASPAFFILALLVYSIKEVVALAMWIKISGIYNIANEEADVRLVISADADKRDKEAYDKLEADMAEIYNVLARKYVSNAKKITKTQIIKELKPKSKEPAVELVRQMRDLDAQIAALDKRFTRGDVKEDTYKELKADLTKRRAKSETLLDLVSMS